MTRQARWRMCTRKVRYGSWRQARQALQAHPWRLREQLHVYSCPLCTGFHLGH